MIPPEPAVPTTPTDPRKANVRLALILASVAAAFFVGFIVKMVFFGHGA